MRWRAKSRAASPALCLASSFPAVVSPTPAGDIAPLVSLPSPVREARALIGPVRDGGRADERERPAAARTSTGEGGARAARRLLSLGLPASWARLIDLPPSPSSCPPRHPSRRPRKRNRTARTLNLMPSRSGDAVRMLCPPLCQPPARPLETRRALLTRPRLCPKSPHLSPHRGRHRLVRPIS